MNTTLQILPFKLSHTEQEIFLENTQKIEFCSGDFVLISGANGSGKSHLLQLIKGIIPQIIDLNHATRNAIVYNNSSIENLPELAQNEIAYLGQIPYTGFVIDHVLQDLWFSSRGLHSMDHNAFEKDILRILSDFDILQLIDRKISSLSSGEQQLINVTRILLQQPKVLLLDEFGEYLSNNNLQKVIDCVKDDLENMIVIVADHNPSEIIQYITQQIYIQDSQLKLRNFDLDCYMKNSQFPVLISNTNSSSIESTLTIKDLSFTWNNKLPASVLFSTLNINLSSQQIIGIYGNNSSGKSTLLQILVRQLSPSSGEIELFNKSIKNISKNTYFQNIHVLFTNSILHFFEVNIENELKYLVFSPEFILTKINLIDKKHLHFSALSNGEQKRLALATVIFSKAKLILLDDPFLGQDQENRIALEELIHEIRVNLKTSFIIVSNKISLLPKKLHQIYRLTDHTIKPI